MDLYWLSLAAMVVLFEARGRLQGRKTSCSSVGLKAKLQGELGSLSRALGE